MLSQSVAAADMPGKQADRKTAAVIHADHRRVGMLVLHCRGQQTHRRAHRHKQDQAAVFPKQPLQHRAQGPVIDLGIATRRGQFDKAAFQIEAGVSGQAALQIRRQPGAAAGQGNDGRIRGRICGKGSHPAAA